VLIVVSLMPFAKFLPGDIGRFQVRASSLDTGAAMLRVFDRVQAGMGGSRHFLLQDEALETDANGNGRADPGDAYRDVNGNQKWDRGWLSRYHSFCEIEPEDLPQAPSS
jgi:hypothetical protein